MFQSFLFWMLIRKTADLGFANLFCSCFNPSYSGCWFGSSCLNSERRRLPMFQSFLFWMLIRKRRAPLPAKLNPLKFQSFLFWMLIRKKQLFDINEQLRKGFNPSYSGCWFGSPALAMYLTALPRVSILLILDVDSEAALELGLVDEVMCFNPSYSGCWFGRQERWT